MIRGEPLARLRRTAGWSVGGALAGRVAALVSAVLLARILGPAHYGEYVLVLTTITSVASVSTSGLGIAASKYLADLHGVAAARRDSGIAIVAASAAGSAVLGCALLSLAAGPLARHHFHRAAMTAPLMLGALALAFATVQGVAQGALNGLERFRINALFSSGGAIVLACTLPLCAWLGGVMGGLVAWTAVTGVCACYGVQLVCKGTDWRNALRKGLLRSEARRFTAVSAPMMLSALVMAPVNWLALSLLARTPAGFAQVGQFNAAYQWYMGLIFIPAVLAGTVLPALSRMRTAGDGEGFASLTRHSIATSALVACASSLLVWLIAGRLMELYGPAYHDAASLLRWLAAAAAANGLNAAIGQIMTASNRLWFGLLVNLLWSLTYLGWAAWQVPRIGALGLAQGLVIAYAVHTLIHLGYLRQHLRDAAADQQGAGAV